MSEHRPRRISTVAFQVDGFKDQVAAFLQHRKLITRLVEDARRTFGLSSIGATGSESNLRWKAQHERDKQAATQAQQDEVNAVAAILVSGNALAQEITKGGEDARSLLRLLHFFDAGNFDQVALFWDEVAPALEQVAIRLDHLPPGEVQIMRYAATLRAVAQTAEGKKIEGEFQAEMKAHEKRWQDTYGREFPTDVEDVVRLFVEAGGNAETAMKGEWTYADVFPIIEGFLLREKREQARTAKPRLEADATTKIAEKNARKSKRDGDTRVKIIAALTKHHQYADGGCLNREPIGNNTLANEANVANSTASDFFKEQFGSHDKYQVVCCDAGRLAEALKVLNGEFSPQHLYGRRPPNEDDRDAEGDE